MSSTPRPTLSRKIPPGTHNTPPRRSLMSGGAHAASRALPVVPRHERPIKPRSPRQLAREMALQAVYHDLMNPDSIELIIAQILREQKRSWSNDQQEPNHRAAPSAAMPEAAPWMNAPRKPMAYAGALLQSAETPRPQPAAPPAANATLPQEAIMSTANKALPRADRPFFRSLTLGVVAHRASIEAQLIGSLDRSLPEVSPMVRAILILGAYELAMLPITPVQVILNEAVELAKRFASEEAYRYVNGVLEKFALGVRAEEMKSLR